MVRTLIHLDKKLKQPNSIKKFHCFIFSYLNPTPKSKTRNMPSILMPITIVFCTKMYINLNTGQGP